jgi:hypothetical protein
MCIILVAYAFLRLQLIRLWCSKGIQGDDTTGTRVLCGEDATQERPGGD